MCSIGHDVQGHEFALGNDFEHLKAKIGERRVQHDLNLHHPVCAARDSRRGSVILVVGRKEFGEDCRACLTQIT